MADSENLPESDSGQRPRVALALGSGGARGYAHIGVIDELHDRGYQIVGIAGSSMGALVGRFGWGTAAIIQLALLPVIGIIAMALIDPNKLIVPKKA